jgi:hypothetical protein
MPAQPATPAVLSSTAATTCDLRVELPDCGRPQEPLSLVPEVAGAVRLASEGYP